MELHDPTFCCINAFTPLQRIKTNEIVFVRLQMGVWRRKVIDYGVPCTAGDLPALTVPANTQPLALDRAQQLHLGHKLKLVSASALVHAEAAERDHSAAGAAGAVPIGSGNNPIGNGQNDTDASLGGTGSDAGAAGIGQLHAYSICNVFVFVYSAMISPSFKSVLKNSTHCKLNMHVIDVSQLQHTSMGSRLDLLEKVGVQQAKQFCSQQNFFSLLQFDDATIRRVRDKQLLKRVHGPGFDGKTFIFCGNHSVFPLNLPSNTIFGQIIRANVQKSRRKRDIVDRLLESSCPEIRVLREERETKLQLRKVQKRLRRGEKLMGKDALLLRCLMETHEAWLNSQNMFNMGAGSNANANAQNAQSTGVNCDDGSVIPGGDADAEMTELVATDGVGVGDDFDEKDLPGEDYDDIDVDMTGQDADEPSASAGAASGSASASAGNEVSKSQKKSKSRRAGADNAPKEQRTPDQLAQLQRTLEERVKQVERFLDERAGARFCEIVGGRTQQAWTRFFAPPEPAVGVSASVVGASAGSADQDLSLSQSPFDQHIDALQNGEHVSAAGAQAAASDVGTVEKRQRRARQLLKLFRWSPGYGSTTYYSDTCLRDPAFHQVHVAP